jgi:hypothetical protein
MDAPILVRTIMATINSQRVVFCSPASPQKLKKGKDAGAMEIAAYRRPGGDGGRRIANCRKWKSCAWTKPPSEPNGPPVGGSLKIDSKRA